MDPLAGTGRLLQTNATDDGLDTPSWLPSVVPEWSVPLAASILVVVLGWLAARLIVRLVGRRIARRFRRPSLTRTTLRGIKGLVYVFALLIILRINGVALGAITLPLTVFSAVVAVVLAPIVGSVISGVFLLADQPYEIGDMIELVDQDRRGFVEDITLRYTKIFTLDNTFLVVPNGTMRDRDVLNYSAEDPRTRLSLEVLVTYESDVPMARRRIEEAARSVEAVIEGGPGIRIGTARYPASPACLIGEFADSGVLLILRYWVHEPYRLQTVASEVQANVWDALESADVEFAYPHSHLVFDETSGDLDVRVDGAARRATPVDRDEESEYEYED